MDFLLDTWLGLGNPEQPTPLAGPHIPETLQATIPYLR
jgi:hypothetical protein